jgi:hypothetical protein
MEKDVTIKVEHLKYVNEVFNWAKRGTGDYHNELHSLFIENGLDRLDVYRIFRYVIYIYDDLPEFEYYLIMDYLDIFSAFCTKSQIDFSIRFPNEPEDKNEFIKFISKIPYNL